MDWLQRLRDHFDHAVWLNPMRMHLWGHPTVDSIADVYPMFELTLDGIELAMRHLSGHRVEMPERPESPYRGRGLRHPNAW